MKEKRIYETFKKTMRFYFEQSQFIRCYKKGYCLVQRSWRLNLLHKPVPSVISIKSIVMRFEESGTVDRKRGYRIAIPSRLGDVKS